MQNSEEGKERRGKNRHMSPLKHVHTQGGESAAQGNTTNQKPPHKNETHKKNPRTSQRGKKASTYITEHKGTPGEGRESRWAFEKDLKRRQRTTGKSQARLGGGKSPKIL